MRAIPAVLTLLVFCSAAPLAAAPEREPIRLVESLSLSPDGTTIVFSWRGDLWRAPAAGGAATRLTAHPAEDVRPFISPDGTQVAFLSNRSGSEQVHVMSIEGGAPSQVTLHTEGSRLYGWFPDGAAVLIRSKRDHHWRASDRYFRKPLARNAPPELLFNDECSVGAVSPDGRTLAFVREGMAWWRKGYRGARAAQLWLYDLETGAFRRLSTGDHGELWPMWGDAGTLYFVSEEDGTWNIWKQDIASGAREQVTRHSEDGVSFPSISADGSTIAYRRLFDIETVATTTGAQPRTVSLFYEGDTIYEGVEHRTLTRATEVAFSKDAREMAFIAGGDVWVMDTELREPRQITNTPEEERHPVFSDDYETLTFVSDAGGQTDIWQVRRSDADRYWWQNDRFRAERLTEDDAVESDLELTPDGKRLAYLVGRGDLWTMAVNGTDRKKHVSSWSGLQFTFSPDARWVAYSRSDDDFNWDIWIQPLDGSSPAVNVSLHPDNDRDPAWSPDGRTLAFVGRRWDRDTDICYVPLRKEDAEEGKRERTLEKALAKMKGRKKKGGPAKKSEGKSPAPAAAADPLAGTWKGSLTGPEPIPTDGLGLVLRIERKPSGYACAFEVTGQFSSSDGTFTFDEKSGAVTFSAVTPLGPLRGEARVKDSRMEGSWSIEGVMEGTFVCTRDEAPAGASTPAKQTGADKKKSDTGPEKTEIDFENLNERIRRITITDSDESGLFWSPDSKKLAFRASVKGARGLYTVTFPDTLTPKLLTSARGSGARWLSDAKVIGWLSGGVPATMTSAGKSTSYAFRVRQTVDLKALHAAAFDMAWRTMRDHYYDPSLGGNDWDAIRAKYAGMASHCQTRTELELVANLMLGELNGSHLGFRAVGTTWRRSGWTDVTGHLGLRFDPAHEGPGLKVRDVVRDSPAFEERSRILPGEIVLRIDGEPVDGKSNLGLLLTGDPARFVEVEVQDEKGETRTVSMQPTSYAAIRRSLYEHWLEDTRAAVASASKGRLGYLHVRGMNWPSFLRFEAELYKVGHGKDGLIIDVRDNGGGFTTDHLLTCLTQPRHAITKPRGGGEGYPHDRMVYAPWFKPVVVLCNQNSFSNAEIFSHAIKNLERGIVVGVPTAGGVISTGGTTVMGVGTLRLPFRGWYLATDGEDMELNGCVPHHVLWDRAGDFAAGIDRQLDKAVEVGLAEVEAYAARPRPKLRKASER